MKLAILGDSSSSSIGNAKETYPYKLFEQLSKKSEVSISNYSSIGATSSDLNIYFHKNLKKKHFDYLIIYLGNNESVYSSRKGYVNFFQWKIKNFFNFSLKSYSNLNFLEKIKFKNYLGLKEIANSTQDFFRNLNSIIKTCEKKNIKVILINPIANLNFLPSVKINNFEYFQFIDCSVHISKYLNSSCEYSKKLIQAIEQSENSNFQEAKKIYEYLIKSSKSKIVKLIAKNNYAVIFFIENDKKFAKKIFYELIKEDSDFRAIYYYNLSLVYKHENHENNYKKYIKLSYSSDFDSYRIKDEYRNVIKEFSGNKNIEVLDLEKILNAGDFIDSCHPTNKGHDKIAAMLLEIINRNKKKIFYSKKKK